MITLFITAQIIYTLNISKMENCAVVTPPNIVLDGCYVGRTNHIYVNENTVRPQDFVLYHEIGHSLINKTNPEERIADRFALYIYNTKYPAIYPKVTKQEVLYYVKFCPKQCVQEIINLKVPNVVYPIKSFWIYK